MLFQIKTINGQKKIVPLTADTGTGAPVGSLIAMYKKSSPSGYLYCDGSTFDQTKYPALYQYLGSNVLPDYREFALVGAEENTTDVYNASTNPNGTIHDHDVYTEGQAKDDQLQDHVHEVKNAITYGTNAMTGTSLGVLANSTSSDRIATTITSGRHGTVTRGKRKAVYFYIKATSGLTENQQENVLNTINENLSYSTSEHKTGKKWIDGKDIYSITVTGNNTFYDTSWTNITFFNDNVQRNLTNVQGLIFGTTLRVNPASKTFTNQVGFAISNTQSTSDYIITLEYTKAD